MKWPFKVVEPQEVMIKKHIEASLEGWSQRFAQSLLDQVNANVNQMMVNGQETILKDISRHIDDPKILRQAIALERIANALEKHLEKV